MRCYFIKYRKTNFSKAWNLFWILFTNTLSWDMHFFSPKQISKLANLSKPMFLTENLYRLPKQVCCCVWSERVFKYIEVYSIHLNGLDDFYGFYFYSPKWNIICLKVRFSFNLWLSLRIKIYYAFLFFIQSEKLSSVILKLIL